LLAAKAKPKERGKKKEKAKLESDCIFGPVYTFPAPPKRKRGGGKGRRKTIVETNTKRLTSAGWICGLSSALHPAIDGQRTPLPRSGTHRTRGNEQPWGEKKGEEEKKGKDRLFY